MQLLIIASLILILGYSLFILVLWLSPGDSSPEEASPDVPVTVVIPFRNEEKKLPALLEALRTQQYDIRLLEILFINDHSTDRGALILESWAKEHPGMTVRLLALKEEKGKKAALYKGISRASHDIIIQTDADCTMGPEWLRYTVAPFAREPVKVSLGLVKMIKTPGLPARLFALEFLSLQASGAALVNRNIPVMANGANLAYRKNVWLQSHPEEGSWASGDDVFFIQRLARESRSGIYHNPKSVVLTETPQTIGEFISQRVRWGSKTPAYPLWEARFIAALVAAANAALAAWLIALLIQPGLFRTAGAMLVLKSVPDFLLIRRYARKTGQQKLLTLFPLAAVLYPVYIVVAGLFILFLSEKRNWKGRSLRHREK